VSLRSAVARLGGQEDLNFLLTNRIPRLALTRFMGWFSRVEQPLVRSASIALWRFFCDVDLTDSRPTRFRSLHEAFTRPLRPGARSIDADPEVIVSPCDAIVGAHGRIEDGRAYQIKGFPYGLDDLLGDQSLAREFASGWFVTLRLTAGMYHRFHAPHDLCVEQVRYISGDTWNVNPIALKRIERLFCKNERAPITVRLEQGGQRLVLVPVAAVLVASIRLPFLDRIANIRAGGERAVRCAARFTKGEEMGWFEHGSTIIVLAPPGCAPVSLEEGQTIRMGEPLFLTAPAEPSGRGKVAAGLAANSAS
jgi:phosphatidylserine decarboxylase